MLGRLGPNQWSATLFVFPCFESIEAFAEPSFLGPLPVLIKTRITIRLFHGDSLEKSRSKLHTIRKQLIYWHFAQA